VRTLAFCLGFTYLFFAFASNPEFSWKTSKEKGKGSITIFWHKSEPFVFYDKNGNLTGKNTMFLQRRDASI